MTEKSKKIGPQNFTLNCELPKTRKEWNDLAGRSSNPSSAYTTDSLVSFMASSACTDLADFRAKAVVPPADGGAKAMLFMLSAFVIEAVMWGETISISCDQLLCATRKRLLALFGPMPRAK